MSEQQGGRSGWTYTRWGYAIEHCFRQFTRRKLASLSTLLVLGITLTLPFMLFFAYATLQALAGKSLEGESITVFLKPEISDVQGEALADQWLQTHDLRKTEFISSTEALITLESNSDLDGILQILGDNPLPGAIILYPQTTSQNETDLENLAELMSSSSEVDQVQLDLQWVHRLRAIISLVKWIGGLLAVFLTLTALLVIANTIRLELARRRTELEVAQLLGASSGFNNRPVLLTGAFYGLLGGLIACIIALSGLIAIQGAVEQLSNLYSGEISWISPTSSQIAIALSVSILLGLAGAISSLNSTSHELTH